MHNILKSELDTLKNLPEIIEKYISAIPLERIDLKRGNDVWTIREHICHIAGVQKMLLGRIELIMNNDKPVIEPYFPEKDIDVLSKYKSIEEAFKEYKTARKDQIKLLKKCSENDFMKRARHKEYSNYTIPLIVKHMIFHEYWHMYRIEEVWLTNDEYFR